MVASTPDRLEDLIALARDRADASRRILLENMTDLFLSPAGRLSDRERALMSEIIGKLLHELEMEVRQALAQRLAQADAAPHELLIMLANDQIAVARPILLQSRLLHDEDLIEVVRNRSHEHRLTVAMREGLSAAVADALIDFGDDQVIETLLANHDASLSRQAIDYLTEESKRVDQFQEPLLRRPDLPAELAHRMFWWVSAGLRQAILTRYKIDAVLLDDLLENATASTIRSHGDGGEADRLAAHMSERGELSERYVLQNLRGGHVGAAIAGLAKLAGLDGFTAKRVVLDPGGEALAACCKSAGFSRAGFATTFMLTREAHERGHATDPVRLAEILELYDQLTRDQARAALRYWMRDNTFIAAIDELSQSSGRGGRRRVEGE